MNANEISPKANVRMNRIQKVSKSLRLILQYGIPILIIAYLIFTLLNDYQIKVPFFSYTPDPSKVQQHTEVVRLDSTNVTIMTIYGCVRLFLFLFWYRAVLKLFGFFEKGILFTAETVHCIQILGGIYIAKSLLALTFHFLLPNLESQFMGDMFTGFFIIFIGWLIDEARKIREEQELTV